MGLKIHNTCLYYLFDNLSLIYENQYGQSLTMCANCFQKSFNQCQNSRDTNDDVQGDPGCRS